MDRNSKRTIWKVGTLLGGALLAVGVGAGYVDVATHFSLDINYHYFGPAILIGVLMSFVAVIGWAKQCESRTRLRMAGIVFTAPLAAALVGYPIDGFNVHGPSALLLFLVVPSAALLVLILLIMAGF